MLGHEHGVLWRVEKQSQLLRCWLPAELSDVQAIGNHWTPSSLRLVLCLGMGMGIVPGVISFFFDDSKTLGAVSEGLLASEHAQRAVAGQPSLECPALLQRALLACA